jgi:quercetin dioxygenase-like cupin family protein
VLLGIATVVTALGSGEALATPASGFTSTTLAQGNYDEFDVFNQAVPPSHHGQFTPGNINVWLSMQKTKGQSDLYVQSNTWQAGGTTGWHTHPGHSLITVTSGTLTAYEGDDPNCEPHVLTPGMGFVDPGAGHVHVIRNEGFVEATTITVQLIPDGAVRRIDAPDPGNCPF